MKLSETYTITLDSMHFYVQIGVGEDEKKIGEPIVVSVKLTAKTQPRAFLDDDFTNSPDYSEIYSLIRETVKAPVNLLERLAYKIGEAIINTNGILAAQVTVTKPNPPVGADGMNASVTITVAR